LGLPQDVYARLVGVSQDVVSKWEHGRRVPRDPVSVRMRLGELEDILEDLIAELVADVVVGGDPVELVTYATDEDWWAASPGARRAGLPAQLHRVATARAAVELAEEFGCRVEIVAG
jgi:transcriptional regulator with XRE-family HTH domain